MANMIVMPEAAFEAATLKMSQARTVAELTSCLTPSEVPGSQLRDEALSLIMALTHEAFGLMAAHGKAAKA